jgi:hypothetical protein
MKKINNKNIWCLLDILAITIALSALSCNLTPTGHECLNNTLCLIAGAIGFYYFVSSVFIFFFNRPKFDWYLVNGNYLGKVVALVLLFPSIIASCFLLYNSCHKNSEYSPKNLVYDENLYTYNNAEKTILDTARCKYFTESAFLGTHNLELGCDSIIIQKNKLPKTIISKQEDPSIFWTVYYHFIDPGNQHMTTSQTGRGWSALIAILGVFLLNGLLVSSIIGWIDSRKEKWLKGEVRYRCFLKLKKHYVVIGGNDVTVGIVSQIVNNIIEINKVFRPYVLIQTSRDVESFRRELFSNLTEEQQKLIIIYYGNRTSKEDINDWCIENAKEVYIIGEDIRTDDIESYHDTINMKCLKMISNNIQNVKKYSKENPLICRVMFEYQTSFNILQVTDIDGKKIDFKPFNYYETWAQNVLICQELETKENCEYLPLEGFDGIQAGQDKFVHFIVVGMSRMGLAMAIEAAHLAHYPNFCTNKKRTRITFIDASMEQEKHFFMSRFKEMFSLACYRDITYATEDIYNDLETYPWVNPLEDVSCKSPYCNSDHLGKDFIDIEWEFINGSVENPNIQKYIADAATNADAKLTIAICLPENSRAIAAATYLPDSVYKSDSTLQILVYQRLNDDLLKQINLNDRYNKKLRAFGMNSLCYNSGLVEISEFIAKKVNYAYDQYAWERIKMRYKGEGLIDDDYDSLSNYLYSDTRISSGDKEYIREECEKWMDGNNNEGCYQVICEKLKIFQNDLGRYISKQNEHSEGKSGKSKSAKMWSNKYNVYSMWTKFRCFGVNPTKPQDFEDRIVIMSELGKMEHNRWIVEQLLLRFRPLMEDEQDKAQITNLYSSTKQKGIYKNRYDHLDICSNDKLNSIDYNMAELD